MESPGAPKLGWPLPSAPGTLFFLQSPKPAPSPCHLGPHDSILPVHGLPGLLCPSGGDSGRSHTGSQETSPEGADLEEPRGRPNFRRGQGLWTEHPWADSASYLQIPLTPLQPPSEPPASPSLSSVEGPTTSLPLGHCVGQREVGGLGTVVCGFAGNRLLSHYCVAFS